MDGGSTLIDLVQAQRKMEKVFLYPVFSHLYYKHTQRINDADNIL